MRTALLAAAVAVPVILGGQWLLTRGEIAQGVSVGGVDVSGMSRDSARAKLINDLGSELDQPVLLRAGTVEAEVVPARLGVTIDVERTLDRAFAAGGGPRRLVPYLLSYPIEPVLVLPSTVGLPAPLASVERRPRDARPVVSADGTVSVVPARDGIKYDTPALLRGLAAAALAGDSALDITPVVAAPAISTDEATKTADLARTLLAGPIALTWHGKKRGTLRPEQMAPVLRVRHGADAYALAFETSALRAVLAPHAAGVTRPAVNATWATDGHRARVVPAKDGREVDVAATGAAILAAAQGGSRSAEVAVMRAAPSRTTDEARVMGIRQQISTVTTDLGSSSANRIFNVRLMADILDRQVIPPGGVFSFNGRVGPRTPARGFKEGQAIIGGLLLPSIGGGVCQVATTIFDAAFYAGFPVQHRINHAWYISHYAMGMDATVADGGPDLVFTNDSQYAVLIRASATASTMTVSLYSTSRGLQVEKQAGAPFGYVDPLPRYIRNPALKGKEKIQKTQGVRGFSIVIKRVVRRNGKIIRQDSFTSNYHPEAVIYVVGAKFKPTDGRPVEAAPPQFAF
jgi:vancomycin resistance protein YoaR